MAKGKQRAWHVLDGLYRDVEDARRHFEHKTNPEGAAAYERWLEVVEIAQWHLDGDTDLEDDSGDGDSADEDADGPDEGRQQLDLPGTGSMGPDVPRGTQVQSVGTAPSVVGAGEGLTHRPVTFTARKDKRRGT